MLVMLGLLLGPVSVYQESVFPDIPENHWAYSWRVGPPSTIWVDKSGRAHFDVDWKSEK